MSLRRRAVFGAFSVFLSTATSFGAYAQSHSQCVMRFGMSDEAFDFDPWKAYDRTHAALVANHLMHTLMTFHSSGENVLRGAASIEIDTQQSEIHIMLDPTCRWNDGTTVTAADFAAGLLYGMQFEEFASFTRLARVAEAGVERYHVDVNDSLSLTIGYDGNAEALLQFISTPSFAPLPLHQVADGEEYYAQPLSERAYAGPYYVASEENFGITLERNPYYCSALLPQIDTVELHSFSSDERRIRALAEGRIDISRHVPDKQLQAILERREDLDLQLVPSGAIGMLHLLINPNSPNQESEVVRQAMALALNYEDFVTRSEGALHSSMQRSEGYVANVGGGVNPYIDLDQVSHTDVQQARRLMEGLGYSSENPLRTRLTTFPLSEYETAARQTISMLSQAYFYIDYVAQDSVDAAFLELTEGAYDLFIIGYVANSPDKAELVSWLRRAYLDELFEQAEETSTNLLQISSELDALEAKIHQERDPLQRIDYINQTEALIGETRILLPLYGRVRSVVVTTNFIPNEKDFTSVSGFPAQYWTNTDCHD